VQVKKVPQGGNCKKVPSYTVGKEGDTTQWVGAEKSKDETEGVQPKDAETTTGSRKVCFENEVLSSLPHVLCPPFSYEKISPVFYLQRN
jgi:hypothetical protein